MFPEVVVITAVISCDFAHLVAVSGRVVVVHIPVDIFHIKFVLYLAPFIFQSFVHLL